MVERAVVRSFLTRCSFVLSTDKWRIMEENWVSATIEIGHVVHSSLTTSYQKTDPSNS